MSSVTVVLSPGFKPDLLEALQLLDRTSDGADQVTDVELHHSAPARLPVFGHIDHHLRGAIRLDPLLGQFGRANREARVAQPKPKGRAARRHPTDSRAAPEGLWVIEGPESGRPSRESK